MTDNIYTKMAAIQQRLCVPKSHHNKFGNYNYRNCEDIMEAVKPLLIELKLVLTVSDEIVVFSGHEDITESVNDKGKITDTRTVSDARFYIKATATITDGTNSISNSAFARECFSKKGMDASQLTGSTSSYARKYALNGLLCIDDSKDADSEDNTQPKAPAKVKEPTAPALQLPYANSKGEVVMQPTLEAWVAAFTKFVAAKGMAAVEANRATVNKVIEMIPEASAQLNAIITKAEDEDRIRRNPLNAG